MYVRKLTTWQEWLEAERISSTAFLEKFEQEKSKKDYMEQERGEKERTEDAWGGFLDDGTMTSSLVVYHHRQILDGNEVDCGELNMVSSLPEARQGGGIRNIMKAVLTELSEQKYVLSFLHPFSFQYYRQFGFELCSSPMKQKLPIAELKDFPCDYTIKMVENDEDLVTIRNLYEKFILDKNLAVVRPEREWHLQEDGDFGPKDFFGWGKTRYSYILSDQKGKSRAYVKFRFEPSKENFLVGTLVMNDMIYDSPEAFRNVLGFLYRMRAKCESLSVELPDEIDLAMLIPDGDNVTRTLSSYSMVRILDVKNALLLMKHPEDSGNYVIEVIDDFLPQNNGFYSVSYDGGKAQSVEFRKEGNADLRVSVQTLTQLVVGLSNLNMALYRTETKLNKNMKTLEKVFIKKKIYNQ